MIRALMIALLLGVSWVLGGCQFLEVGPGGSGPGASDPLPPPTTAVPRLSPSIEVPPPVY